VHGIWNIMYTWNKHKMVLECGIRNTRGTRKEYGMWGEYGSWNMGYE
jgi:hypothetical protein